MTARETKRGAKNERGEGEGKERNVCRQTPRNAIRLLRTNSSKKKHLKSALRA